MSNEGLRKRGLLLIWHERGAGVPRAAPPKTDRRGGVEGGSCGDRRPARNAAPARVGGLRATPRRALYIPLTMPFQQDKPQRVPSGNHKDYLQPA